ncbi:MAG: hypothetical protein JRL30_05915 [Deltaproteobacteria bacterium]|nr:hypothetical protein [Deltaproteobacteria bacterium]
MSSEKNSVCVDADPYVLEQVRYIRGNPFKAGLVNGLNEYDVIGDIENG